MAWTSPTHSGWPHKHVACDDSSAFAHFKLQNWFRSRHCNGTLDARTSQRLQIPYALPSSKEYRLEASLTRVSSGDFSSKVGSQTVLGIASGFRLEKLTDLASAHMLPQHRVRSCIIRLQTQKLIADLLITQARSADLFMPILPGFECSPTLFEHDFIYCAQTAVLIGVLFILASLLASTS
jgi:hypothetical protein